MAITVLKPIKIDVKQDTYIYPHKVKQNDTLTLNFSVWDDNVSADLTGYRCILKANKVNGKGYEIRDGTITGNNIEVICTSSFTQFAGDTVVELCFLDAINNKQKSSFNITLEVQKSVLVSNNIGELPQCVITAAEKLDSDLMKVEDAIQKAEAENTKLNNTISSANTANSNLNSLITSGNTLKTKLDSTITEGKTTAEELKKVNGAYTAHIKNSDIHVTKEQKDKWELTALQVNQILVLLDKLTVGTLDDENGDSLVDENNEQFIG